MKSSKTPDDIILPQWFTGIGVNLLLIQAGIMSGWTSPALARLTASDSPIPLTAEEASWVASVINLGRLVGAVLGPLAINYVGSKKAMLVTLLSVAVSWLIIVVTTSVEWLYVARVFSGMAFGMIFSVYPLYLGEVSVPKIRGALVSLATTGYPLGQILASVCGSYTAIKTSACIYLAFCMVLIILLGFLPESPHHLIKIGKLEAAKMSVDWYRAGRDVDTEVEDIQKFMSTSGSESFMEKLQKFKSPSIRSAIFQVTMLYIFCQLSGWNSIVFYMEIILTHARFTLIPPSEVVIYVSVLGAVASVFSMLLIDRCGRRFLFVASSIGVCLAMISLIIYFGFMDRGADMTSIQWLPMVSMYWYIIWFSLGLLTVPGTVMSEMLPASVKCIAASFTSIVSGLVAFLASKTYQTMVDSLGESYVFLMYAVAMFLVVPYVIFLMPETKGKSLLQIQDELIHKSKDSAF